MKTLAQRFNLLVASWVEACEQEDAESMVVYQQGLLEMGAQRDCDGNWHLQPEEDLLEDCV